MVTGVDIMYNFKKQIADIGKKLADKGLSPGFSGNISVRFEDKILVTPSGYSLGELEADDIVVLDFDFNIIEGDKKPSSESKMHALIYKKRPDLNALVHCHSPKASVFAVNGIPLVQPILAENIFTLGDIPVAKYYLPSSEELAQEVCSFFDVHDCVLMQNHGVIVGGKDLRTAFYKMDTVEYYAEVCILANLTGKPCELSDEQKREIIELRKRH